MMGKFFQCLIRLAQHSIPLRPALHQSTSPSDPHQSPSRSNHRIIAVSVVLTLRGKISFNPPPLKIPYKLYSPSPPPLPHLEASEPPQLRLQRYISTPAPEPWTHTRFKEPLELACLLLTAQALPRQERALL